MASFSYDDVLPALYDAETQAIAGVILEAQLASTYIDLLFKGKLKVATPPLIDVSIRLVTRKEKKGELLIERFNSGLEKLEEWRLRPPAS